MPLLPGSGKQLVNANIAELMAAYERKGKIGNTDPENQAHALRIAMAISHRKAREGKKHEKG